MKAADFLDFVRDMEKAVFTTNDAVKITGKDARYVHLYIHRLKKRGLVEEIERGKFALFGHPFSVASGILFPSYVSFLSGLSYYDLTTQMPRIVYVACRKSKRPVRLRDYEIKFIRLKKERFFGYKKEKYRGKLVFVAEPEKAIVDSLLLPEYCPIAETFYALKRASSERKIDVARILRYAMKMKSSVLLKRLGLMLELLGYDFHSRLKKKLTNKIGKLDPLGPKTQKKNNEWKLYVNEELV